MALTESIEYDKIEVIDNTSVHVRKATVIKKDGTILQKSKAVFYILRIVKMLFIIRILILILPTFISNIVYDIVAFTRYKFFGKYESCPIINGDLKSRIIE